MFAALCVTGCMGDGADDTPGSELVPRNDAYAKRVAIEGGTPAQRRLLRSILTGIGETRITRIEVTDAAYWKRPKGVSITFDAKRRHDVQAEWEQGLVAAVFRDRSHAAGLPPVIAFGSRQLHGASRIEGGPSPRFKPFRRADAAAVVAGIERAADRGGAKVDRIVLREPEGLAPLIRLRVADPGRFLSERWDLVLGALDDDTARYEGRFLEIVDARRRPVWQDFGVSRIHWGGTWHDKRYSGCARFSLSTPVGYDPPPCPVEG